MKTGSARRSWDDRHAKPHPDARGTDIILSNEILRAARTSSEAIWALLRSSPEGQSPEEADARLAADGRNLIAQEGRPGIPRELWGRAKDPLNALLLCLAIVSYWLGDIRAAAVITIIVMLAISTAFIQEHRSNNAAAKLRAMVKTMDQRPSLASSPIRSRGSASSRASTRAPTASHG
jgi:P-type Mg2+ transporter